MYDYYDFAHSSQVRMVLTGEIFTVDFVDTAAPYLVIIDEFGDKRTCPASELEPMDCKRVVA